VLYVDGYPRWEQRYLKNLLLREGSIESSSLLLATDRKYIQDGDIELDALPDSLEQWREFDVLVLGDVRPDVFTWDQLDQIREHIAVNGAGLIWIGGPSATPAAWWGTSLADVLPFTASAYDGSAVGDPVLMQPSDVATRLGILRLGNDPEEQWPRALASPQAGWSQLRWMQFIRNPGLKPITEVVAWGVPAYGSPEDATPAVMSMRYGAGRVIYVATDEIWRWRYGRGELLPERFWVQMIRLLGRESLARTGQSALLTVSPRRSVVDQPVRIEVELLEQSLIDRDLGSVTVEVTRQRLPGEDDFEVFEDEVVLRPEGRDHRRYAAVWLPPSPGRWEVRARDTLSLGSALSGEAIVSLPDDEMRRPETDHPALAALSQATEGDVIAPADMGELKDKLRDRSVILRSEITESLWDTPLALILVVTLLTCEWVGRRLIKLL
ncbi:MAG: hypothetical protein KDA21_09890, partial [Phycisphaerales bacterium]|nr:hypothetical protein [Phycisphaerales bacterium]